MIELLIVIFVLPLMIGVLVGASNEKTRFDLYNKDNAPQGHPAVSPSPTLTDEERYMRIREAQVTRNRMAAISRFIHDHSLGIDWWWTCPGCRRITVKDEDGLETTYTVYYKSDAEPEGSKIFTFRKVQQMSVTEAVTGLHRTEPLLRCSPGKPLTDRKDFLIYAVNRGKNTETAEKLRAQMLAEQKAKDLNGFFAKVLQSRTRELQNLAYRVCESGNPATVAGADFNDGCQLTKHELRVLAEEFEAIGFIVNPINFKTQELTLNVTN